MEENSEIQDKIDQYLLNKMSNDEKSLFENEMITFPELFEKVNIQKMIFDEINRKEEILSIFRNADYEHDRKIKAKKIFIRRYLSIAAIVTAVSFFVIWQPTQFSNQKIADAYGTFSPNEFLLDNGNTGNTRFASSINLDFDSLEIQSISQSLKLYNNHKYKLAADSFEKIVNLRERNTDLALYMSISQFRSGDTKKSIVNLDYLSNLIHFQGRELACYYLALSNIQSGNLSEARKILKILKATNGKYSISAEEILHKMRYF